MRALVAGWFTFEYMGATAGDLIAAEVVGGWLQDAGCPYDVALTEHLGPGVDWQTVDPGAYSHVVFVCGPLGNGEPATTLFERFPDARLVGVDLSMLHPTDEWNPFDLLLERDSDRTARPDISMLAAKRGVAVVGVVLVHVQKEYEHGRHGDVHAAINEALEGLDVAVVRIDTCLDPPNAFGLRNAAEIESVIARMDAIVTTRLHGLVLGLKNGVPVLAVDPVDGGAKVHRQAQTLGWPHALTPEQATPQAIRSHLTACLEHEARALVRRCCDEARVSLAETRDEFVRFFVTQAGG